MHIRVLGSAAGGGVPQWNCGCDNCQAVRSGSTAILPRSQECVAVSGDREAWFLINASPDIAQQIASFSPLWPRAPRHSPIGAVVLTSGDLDHCLGLFSLRESQPLRVYATAQVRRGITENNVMYRTLQRFPGQVEWIDLVIGKELPLLGVNAASSGLAITAVAAPGKAPLHLEGQRLPCPEDNIGLSIRDTRTGNVVAYLSSVASSSPAVRALLDACACVFFDGTFWSSDELIAQGLGHRRAEDMAHWPLDGAEGSAHMLSQLRAPRRVLIHLNNTNPVLREDSPERASLDALGIEVATDGMELVV